MSRSAGARKTRVVHIEQSTFGTRFSGQTHWLFSLLSGWRDEDIVLDLWGPEVRPLNIGSGSMDYRLAGKLWPSGLRETSFFEQLTGYARQLAFLATHARSFDLAHFHELGWDTLVSPLLLHLLGKKAVYTSSLYGSDNPSEVKQSRGGRLAVWLLRRFDGIVALSPLLAEDYRAHGFTKVACLPNFLALPQLASGRDAAAREELRGRLSIPQDATALLFVGAVIRRKGVDLLADSFARLALQHPDLWLILVGQQSREESPGIDEGFVRAVKEKLDRAGVAARVIWAGMQRDKNAVAQYFSAADIFVFPTRMEGLGNVLIEASAAGLPSVATNLPGITDVVVTEGEAGYLVPPEDVDALTQAVERLVVDRALRARMGNAARADSKRFGFEDYGRQLRAFYLSVAGKPADESSPGVAHDV